MFPNAIIFLVLLNGLTEPENSVAAKLLKRFPIIKGSRRFGIAETGGVWNPKGTVVTTHPAWRYFVKLGSLSFKLESSSLEKDGWTLKHETTTSGNLVIFGSHQAKGAVDWQFRFYDYPKSLHRDSRFWVSNSSVSLHRFLKKNQRHEKNWFDQFREFLGI